ncbi:long-chain fatty acid--CoA ligase [Aeromicrobium sp. A1-2]|uniref:AMP-dependent synthetase/ligase n=1 Tax=Aeromicrobium sp. A1-2 TaxID=2107713 RepID=UPI000E540831|nr:long-chain fatty acid--CoA ligase [Aeromicrobium sp. A1-2]AXT86458.1 long-chain fatty acid--CoA ligase [Aeromicrobium sp. A1-2]
MSTVQTSLPQRIRARATTHPDGTAMHEKYHGLWEPVTWAGYWDAASLVGNALLSLGIEPGDRIAVHSENRREWLFCDIGITAARAATVGLYPTNPAPEVHHVLFDSGARLLVVEDQEQLDKALDVIGDLPDLQHLVYLEPRGIVGSYDDPRLMSWDSFIKIGEQHRSAHPEALGSRLDAVESSDLATLVYTSGTTGPPKGAMLTMGNVEFVLETLQNQGAFVDPPAGEKDLLVSYLPLCHVAERVFTTWFNAGVGTQVFFAESIDTVPQNLREVQPTLLFGVPRIWEKLVASVHIRMSGASRIKRANFAVWMRLARWIGRTLVARQGRHSVATRIAYGIGWVMLYRPLRERLGLSKVRYAASGAAPISPEVLEFFMGIGLPMFEVYGMTENSAIATANMRGRVRVGTVGEIQPGTELRIDETGEILTRHAGTFAGYWNNPEATAAAIDADGWLHTGDVGEWVDGTHLKITDRLKDIIITAGGKNISPSEIENRLKASPFIKEAIVIGDRRSYLTALIGIELDTVGDWAQKRRLSFTTYRDLTGKPEVIELVQSIVDETNVQFASVETIKAFRLLPKELDHEQGELTATQKVKRSAITAQFSDDIEGMYAGAGR